MPVDLGLNPATTEQPQSYSTTTETEKAEKGYDCPLKLMSTPKFIYSILMARVTGCYHISCVTPDRVWVSDRNNIILINTKGIILHRVEELNYGYNVSKGLLVHTVNRESELIFTDRNFNIKKLSKDMKTSTTFIKGTDSKWKPQCVYLSPYNGDLLVGMHRNTALIYRNLSYKLAFTEKSMVARYNQRGQETQRIQFDKMGREIYKTSHFITENSNGDVVVSDYESGAVVVTDCRGNYRFSYTGDPSGSGLHPLGICTDALSHILVCNDKTKTIQMLNMNGQFLSHQLISPILDFEPYSLSYDVKTHCLWVGSMCGEVLHVYRYIDVKDYQTGKFDSLQYAIIRYNGYFLYLLIRCLSNILIHVCAIVCLY